MKYLIPALVVALPAVTFAQGLQQYIPSFMTFVNSTIIPFMLGIAFLIVVVNIVKYFVVQGTSEEGREKAKSYILYSVMAFVLILIFWGIINIIVNTSDLTGEDMPIPDYATEYGE